MSPAMPSSTLGVQDTKKWAAVAYMVFGITALFAAVVIWFTAAQAVVASEGIKASPEHAETLSLVREMYEWAFLIFLGLFAAQIVGAFAVLKIQRARAQQGVSPP